ncbi:MAG: DUF262 domain-containing protein [Sulfurospirillaceae bacterium]|nr:DUF262 domain-containing protein [Sulfurospirillaceae bacterium]MDD2825627.1 DUF262 domain-containing protein [Sulfurospirillaceae bacterium]
MIKYDIRSKELIDLVNDIKQKRLILAPFFQRNFVWRDSHQIDFIKTILLEYPFPQIFIAKGDLDIDNMINTSSIVDGQQRMTTIYRFCNDKFQVDGKFFSQLDNSTKEKFLKYQVPIIDLQIKHDDPEIQEIFKRLNRTFYSLSTIEKLSIEYASSEFMLFCKYLVKEETFNETDEENIVLPMQKNPNIPIEFIEWAKENPIKYFYKLILEGKIFSSYEISRQSHLLFTMNIISTIMDEFFNRNDLSNKFLEKFADQLDNKSDILIKLERISQKIIKMKFNQQSYWLNKANMFSIIVFSYKNFNKIIEIDEKNIKEKLENFESNLPEEYRIAAKEGVNNKKERLIRNDFLAKILL